MNGLRLERVVEVEARGEPEGEGNGEGSGPSELPQNLRYCWLQHNRQRQVAHHAGNQQRRRRGDTRSPVVAQQESHHQQELAGCSKPQGLGNRQRHQPMIPGARVSDTHPRSRKRG